MTRPGEHDHPLPDSPDPPPTPGTEPMDEPPSAPGPPPPVTVHTGQALYALVRARRIGLMH